MEELKKEIKAAIDEIQNMFILEQIKLTLQNLKK